MQIRSSIFISLFAAASGYVAAGAVRAEHAGTAPSASLFAPVAEVLRDPRCLNCHPIDDRPRQGDDRHVHQMNVTRGPDNMGFTNLRCTACHREANNPHSIVPGAPNWHLAPKSMGWQGLDDAALCATLLDTSKNGGKSVEQLVEHMRSDPLVLWGWAPGKDRKPVHVPHSEFMKTVEAWQAAGTPCPEGPSGKPAITK